MAFSVGLHSCFWHSPRHFSSLGGGSFPLDIESVAVVLFMLVLRKVLCFSPYSTLLLVVWPIVNFAFYIV